MGHAFSRIRTAALAPVPRPHVVPADGAVLVREGAAPSQVLRAETTRIRLAEEHEVLRRWCEALGRSTEASFLKLLRQNGHRAKFSVNAMLPVARSTEVVHSVRSKLDGADRTSLAFAHKGTWCGTLSAPPRAPCPAA